MTSKGALAPAAGAVGGAPDRWAIPAGLAIGGAAGNILDSVGDGPVVDWIDLGPWPIFNLADTFLVTVVVLILVSVPRQAAENEPGGAGVVAR